MFTTIVCVIMSQNKPHDSESLWINFSLFQIIPVMHMIIFQLFEYYKILK